MIARFGHRRTLIAMGALLVSSLLWTLAFAQSRYDKTKFLPSMTEKCKRDHLNDPKLTTALTVLEISLRDMCDCVAANTLSKMNDKDLAYSVENKLLSQDAIQIYLSAMAFCAATLSKDVTALPQH
jgi:hypothetical protein